MKCTCIPLWFLQTKVLCDTTRHVREFIFPHKLSCALPTLVIGENSVTGLQSSRSQIDKPLHEYSEWAADSEGSRPFGFCFTDMHKEHISMFFQVVECDTNIFIGAQSTTNAKDGDDLKKNKKNLETPYTYTVLFHVPSRQANSIRLLDQSTFWYFLRRKLVLSLLYSRPIVLRYAETCLYLSMLTFSYVRNVAFIIEKYANRDVGLYFFFVANI